MITDRSCADEPRSVRETRLDLGNLGEGEPHGLPGTYVDGDGRGVRPVPTAPVRPEPEQPRHGRPHVR